MSQIDMKATGTRIKTLAQKNGIKVSDIQKKCGFGTPQTVYKWFRGDTLPSLDNLVLISELFEVGLDDIVVYSKESG